MQRFLWELQLTVTSVLMNMWHAFVQLPIVNYMLCHVFPNILAFRSVVYLWNHSLFPNSVTGLWSRWHIVGGSTIKLIIFTKELCASFTKTSRRLLKDLARDKSVTIHKQNLQQLAIKIFKVKMGIFPIIVKENFNFSGNSNYNLRSGTHLSRPIVYTTHYGTL